MRKKQPILLLCMLLISAISLAQIPQTIDYQGMLKDADGMPVNDTKFMEFRIYSVETGGTALWTEQHSAVQITDGLFSVVLCESSGIGSILKNNSEVYITFVVGGEEMLPRQKFQASPYAIYAKDAEQAYWADDAGNAYWAENADKLDNISSDGFVQQDASGNATIDGTMTADAYEGDGSSLTNLPPTPDSDWTENNNVVYNLTDSIGIGVSNPEARIEVAGRISQSGIGGSTFIGFESGLNDDFSNNRNTFIGYQVGKTNTSGYWNNIIGAQSFMVNETGTNNNAVGYRALYNNDEGSYNTAIGNSGLYSNTSGDNNIGLGFYAAYNNVSGENNIAIGFKSLYNNTYGDKNIAIGSHSSYTGSDYNSSIAIGDSALYDHGDYSYEGCIAIGQNAARLGAGSCTTVIGFETVIHNTTGYNLTAVGWQALRNNTSGRHNTAVGVRALTDNTSGHRNTAGGYLSLYSNVDGNYNTAFGVYSLNSNVSGEGNSAFGDFALEASTGDYNSAFGGTSSGSITTGSCNSSLGAGSLSGNTEGDYNTAIGYIAYYSNYPNFTTYDNSTAIGYGAYISSSNQVRIGNSSVTSIGGYTSWSNLSDGRFKQNVKENVPGLDFILKLKPVTYNLDVDKLNDFLHVPDSVQNISKLKNYANEKSNIQYTGFIAQEVEETANELEFDFSGIDKPQNDESHYSLRYAEFVVPLVKAVQEQQVQIEGQKEIINQLIEVSSRQEEQISQLVKQLNKIEQNK